LLEHLGARWYRTARDLAPVPTARIAVVGEVADRFRQARRVLNHIADRYLFPRVAPGSPSPPHSRQQQALPAPSAATLGQTDTEVRANIPGFPPARPAKRDRTGGSLAHGNRAAQEGSTKPRDPAGIGNASDHD
jgi:hypothetical protein